MSKDFIAPIQVVHLFVVDSTFHIENEPSQNMDYRATETGSLSRENTHCHIEEQGGRACRLKAVCVWQSD